ncbi:hypothetical protein BDZ97DRAFT_1756894 [Flammula alnicola]|nr:hypothetical protein BDZ97DRAFT_1756894 [Flammula alnicola]
MTVEEKMAWLEESERRGGGGTQDQDSNETGEGKEGRAGKGEIQGQGQGRTRTTRMCQIKVGHVPREIYDLTGGKRREGGNEAESCRGFASVFVVAFDTELNFDFNGKQRAFSSSAFISEVPDITPSRLFLPFPDHALCIFYLRVLRVAAIPLPIPGGGLYHDQLAHKFTFVVHRSRPLDIVQTASEADADTDTGPMPLSGPYTLSGHTLISGLAPLPPLPPNPVGPLGHPDNAVIQLGFYAHALDNDNVRDHYLLYCIYRSTRILLFRAKAISKKLTPSTRRVGIILGEDSQQ